MNMSAFGNWVEDFRQLIEPHLHSFKGNVNKKLERFEAWQIVLISVFVTVILLNLFKFLFKDESIWTRSKIRFFKIMKTIPFVKNKIKKELDQTFKDMEKTIEKTCHDIPYIHELRPDGLSKEDVISLAKKYKELETVQWQEGCCSGTIYNNSQEITELTTEIYGMYAWSNPLHADVFPDVRKMEAEVVRMCCNLFHGSSNSCGTMTSGGTESIMLACKVYRDLAIERGIEKPEILCPVSAHAAFDKAAQFFCMKITHVDVDKNGAVNIIKMRSKISKRTCMLVGSVPSFPHGIIDPVLEIAKLGKKYNIPVHVDSCLGGFLVPFMEKAGYNLEPFDFMVDGVTSISADTHKYGLTPKGSSVILYSEKKFIRKQIFAIVNWPGGVYASPTFAGSRPGSIIAATWATLMFMGERGYVDSTKAILDVRTKIEQAIRNIDGLFVYGYPQVSVIGFGSKVFNIYRLSDAMTKLGWNLNALQFPSSIHVCLTLVHTQAGVAEKFINDMSNCVAEIMKDPNAKIGGMAAMYGMAQSLPDRSLVEEIASGFIELCYSTSKQS